MQEFRDALKNTMIFSDLEGAELDILVSCMKRTQFNRGEIVFSEGEEGDTMYVILDGNINIFVPLANGTEISLATIEKGNFFGDMAIIENAPRSASCKAVESCELIALSRSDFYGIIRHHPETALKILYRMMNIMAERFKTSGAALSEMVRWGEGARKKAVTDAFTGMYNRRFLDESFGKYVSRAIEEKKPLSFVMIDMDHFGTLNKKYGEAFGDNVILEAARVYKESFRETDILVRYGGDEFSFILPNTDACKAKELCDAMAENLRGVRFSDNPDVVITLSIGISSVPKNGDTPASLKEEADKAVYVAKEKGRDTIVVAQSQKGKLLPEVKKDIISIAEKNRIVQNIIEEIFSKNSFLLLGHKEPDADCISSLVAFALLLSKFRKEATIFLVDPVIDQLQYLLAICRYNSIRVIQEADREIPDNISTAIILDTPKTEMIMTNDSVVRVLNDPLVRKIELDHHIGADANYTGDLCYRLVFNASSTCEIIGYLSMKLARNPNVQLGSAEFFPRNLALSILTGIVGDSQMGKYLKTKKEHWYYNFFSTIFDRLLMDKTMKGGKNLQSKGNIFDLIQHLSKQEEECYRLMKGNMKQYPSIHTIVMANNESEVLFNSYEDEIIINVSKSAADTLSEASSKLGLVVYYDPPRLSDLVQFRLRRSAKYTKIDLREVITRLGITNGGGHPGAVGFRIKQSEISDIMAYCEELIGQIQEFLAEAEKE
ncbi:MAG: diguanylate cyclase [Spirochaetaceae bacterium]|nr:diguanylate cyclase [Spirochaetaceae bacterium]